MIAPIPFRVKTMKNMQVKIKILSYKMSIIIRYLLYFAEKIIQFCQGFILFHLIIALYQNELINNEYLIEMSLDSTANECKHKQLILKMATNLTSFTTVRTNVISVRIRYFQLYCYSKTLFVLFLYCKVGIMKEVFFLETNIFFDTIANVKPTLNLLLVFHNIILNINVFI